MVKKAPVSKQQQAAKAAKKPGQEKKKWSKGSKKEGITRAVHVTEDQMKKIIKDIPNIVTKTHIAEKYSINGGVAESILQEMVEKSILVKVSANSIINIYAKKREEKPVEKVEVVAE